MTSLPTSFRAFTYTRCGPVEDVLELSQVPLEPLPSPAHVRVRVRSASLNPVDYKLVEYARTSPTPEAPLRIGFDFAGEIVELGADVKGFSLGDSVYGKAPRGGAGSVGEFLAIEAQLVARTPTSLDFDHAAGVPGVGLTSYQSIAEHAKLQRGERLLVLGGSSGTGIFAVQHAKSLGAYVIATTSTKNVEFVRSMGADEVIDYRTQQWGDVLEAHSVDVIYDCGVEPTSWEDRAQRVLKKEGGRFVTLRPGLTPSPAQFGATYQDPMARPSGHDLAEIAKLIDSGKVKVFIDSVFPFEQAKEAFTKLKTGRAVGKVIVQVATQ